LIPHGRQHYTLVSIAGTLARRGVCPEAIEACLLVVNKRAPLVQINASYQSVGMSEFHQKMSKIPFFIDAEAEIVQPDGNDGNDPAPKHVAASNAPTTPPFA